MSLDINKYIGIPWVAGGRSESAADCWGLVMLVYRNELGLELGDFMSDSGDEVVAQEIDEPVNGCLVRAVNCTNGADHWGVYYKGMVLNAQMPHSAAPRLKQFVSRFPVIEFYEVLPNE